VETILFWTVQADRFRSLDQWGILRAGTIDQSSWHPGAQTSTGCWRRQGHRRL